MATIKSLAVDLQLPQFPALGTMPPKLFDELLAVYTAINIVASQLAETTGTIKLTYEELQEYDINSQPKTLNNMHLFYVTFAEAATYGKFMSLNSLGQAIVAQYVSPGVYPRKAIAFCSSASVLAGEVGELCLTGVIDVPANNLIPGRTYLPNTVGNPRLLDGFDQRLGCAWAITPNQLMFTGEGN